MYMYMYEYSYLCTYYVLTYRELEAGVGKRLSTVGNQLLTNLMLLKHYAAET